MGKTIHHTGNDLHTVACGRRKSLPGDPQGHAQAAVRWDFDWSRVTCRRCHQQGDAAMRAAREVEGLEEEETCSPLFIGGPRDGVSDVTVRDSAYICMEYYGTDPTGPCLESALYRREIVDCGETLWVVYVVNDMTLGEAIARLVACYTQSARAEVVRG
jgi:hypothetical protein